MPSVTFTNCLNSYLPFHKHMFDRDKKKKVLHFHLFLFLGYLGGQGNYLGSNLGAGGYGTGKFKTILFQ